MRSASIEKTNEANDYTNAPANVIALNNPKRLAVNPRAKRLHRGRVWKRIYLICKKDDEQRIKQFVADAKIKYGKEYN